MPAPRSTPNASRSSWETPVVTASSCFPQLRSAAQARVANVADPRFLAAPTCTLIPVADSPSKVPSPSLQRMLGVGVWHRDIVAEKRNKGNIDATANQTHLKEQDTIPSRPDNRRRAGPPFESPQLRLPHPFVIFEGWETTTLSIMGIPQDHNTGFLDYADRFTIRSARNDRVWVIHYGTAGRNSMSPRRPA